MAGEFPSGSVAFAFTDVVGSTRAFVEHGERYVEALGRTQALIAEEVARHRGVVVKTEGDGAFLAFGCTSDAVATLRSIQQAERHTTAEGLPLRLRAGVHVGDAIVIDGDYISLAVHIAARVAGAAGAGQILASQEVIDEIGHDCAHLVGDFELRDLPEPVTLWRLHGDDAPPRAKPAKRTNVPAEARTSFVGRDVEVAALRSELRRPGLVCVLGPAGVGKTRLVSELARDDAAERSAGIWLVELGSIDARVEILDAIAAVLGLTGAVGVEPICFELARRGPMVLILDNCEHLIEDVAEIVSVLVDRCEELTVVATSRERLDIEGERVFRLRPLSTDSDAGGAAARLFRDRAAAAGVDIEPQDPALHELCRALDGLPLALELAAAQTANLPLGHLLRAIRAGGLQLERRGGVARQRSMEALVGWSIDALDPDVQDALLRLSVVPGGFDEDVAAAVIGLSGDLAASTLAALTRRSLVDLDGDRYRLLFAVRTVARSRLFARPALAEEARSSTFAHLVQVCSGDDRSLMSRLVAGGDDLRLMLEDGLDWGRAGPVAACGAVALALRMRRGMLFPSERHRMICRQILEVELDWGSPDALILVATALDTHLGFAATLRPDEQWDPPRAQRLVESARELDDPVALATCLASAGLLMMRFGMLEAARALHTESLSIREQLGSHPWWTVTELNAIGVTYHLEGRFAEAEDWYQQAHAAAHGLESETQMTCLNIGEVRLDKGDIGMALDVLAGAARAATRDCQAAYVVRGLLAEALARSGRIREAAEMGAGAARALRAALPADPSLNFYLQRLEDALADAGCARAGG